MTRWLGLCGAATAAGANLWSGSVLAGALWSIGVAVACLGYGALFAYVTKQRASLALLTIVGLAVMLTSSAVLARVGLLLRGTQLAVVAGGLVACVIVPYRAEQQRQSLSVSAFAAAGGLLLVIVALAQNAALIGDGANHSFVVKRLWDTGFLAVHHQFGSQLVGEAYFSLTTGAQSVTLFDAGACAALLVLLLGCELASRDPELGVPVFFVLAVPVILQPAATRDDIGMWSSSVFQVAAFLALHQAIEARRTAWLVLPLAAVLLALRHEYVPLALPFLAAAFVIPVSARYTRKTLVMLGVSWSVALFLMQLGYRTPPLIACFHVGLIWLAVPLTRVALWMLGLPNWRTAAGVLAFAVLSLTITNLSEATSTSFQGPTTLVAVWYAAALCVVLLRDSLRQIAVALVVALIVGFMIFDPSFVEADRKRVRSRLAVPAAKLDELKDLGLPVESDNDVRGLQDHVPPGARVAFWGRSAAHLDFSRNSIRDVSWPSDKWRTEFYLSSIRPRALRRVEYLIVETMLGRPQRDPWGDFSRPRPLDQIADRLEPIAGTGRARLFRVRP